LLLLAGSKILRPPPLPPLTLYSVITPYQNLDVGELDERRFLTSNGMLHGAVIRSSGEPGIAYVRYAALGALFQPRLRRVLVLGMGAGGTGGYLQRRIPDLDVDYVDIDPEIPRIARRFFGFRDSPRSHAHVADARSFLAGTDEQWDLILADTYIGLSVPFHLTTLEFMQEVQRHLAPGGVFTMNLAAGLEDEFSRAIYSTARRAFGTTRAFATQGAGGVLLVAGPGAVGYRPDLEARARELDRRWTFSPTLARMLALEIDVPARGDGRVLRDAFAPVEHLVPIGRMRGLDAARWRELRRRIVDEAEPEVPETGLPADSAAPAAPTPSATGKG
jgi:spermidine synthase